MGFGIGFAMAGASLLAGLSLVGCSSSTNSGVVSLIDGGDAAETVFDAGSPEASYGADSSVGDDAGAIVDNCGTLPPAGRQIISSMGVAVVGVTSDGFAIYIDTTTNIAYAASIAGGTAPLTVGAIDPDTSIVVVSGKAVYFAPSADAGASTGALSVWTAATGSNSLSASAYLPLAAGAWFASVSPDGSHIAYLETVAGGFATLLVSTTDGKTKRPLVANLDLGSAGCPPFAQFAGTTLVAAYCAASTADAGWPVEAGSGKGATIAAFGGPNFAEVPLAANAGLAFALNATGTQVLVSTAAGLLLYPTAGGPAVTVDPNGVGGLFTKDGTSVLYATAAHELKRLYIAAPPSTTLAQSGVSAILDLSPDQNWLLASNHTMDLNSDLYMASAVTPGQLATLWTKPTAAVFGDAFTLDSTFALFFANVASGTGDFYVASTAGGSPTKVTSNAWQEYATTGTRGVVNDNYNANGGSSGNGIADLESFDARTPTVLKTLVTAADANFYPTAAKDEVVYSWSCAPTSSAGVWVMPSP